jgi:hypothetical protein
LVCAAISAVATKHLVNPGRERRANRGLDGQSVAILADIVNDPLIGFVKSYGID